MKKHLRTTKHLFAFFFLLGIGVFWKPQEVKAQCNLKITLAFNPQNHCNITPQSFVLNILSGKPPYHIVWNFSSKTTVTGTNSRPLPPCGDITQNGTALTMTAFFTDKGQSNYTITVTDANGCDTTFTTTWNMVYCSQVVRVDSVGANPGDCRRYTAILCKCDTSVLKFYAAGNYNAGNTYYVELSDANGSFATKHDTIGKLTRTTARTTDSGKIKIYIPCNQPNGTKYRVRIQASNPVGGPIPAANVKDNGYPITISTYTTATLNLLGSPTKVCKGGTIKFTAIPDSVNKFNKASYSWYLNNSKNPFKTGDDDTIYNFNTSGVTDSVDCFHVIMNTRVCTKPKKDTSNTVCVEIDPTTPPQISISSSNGLLLCASTSDTLKAAPVNAGASPKYQWYKGTPPGVSLGPGATNANYITNSIANGDKYYCVITSTNTLCANPNTATSNVLTFSITSQQVPKVTLSSNPAGTTFCSGASITFNTAISGTNAPPAPDYMWYDNGTLIAGTTSSTYTVSNLSNGAHKIKCTIKVKAPGCFSSPTASDSITVNIIANITPTVSISATPDTSVCLGTAITFTADTANGGPGGSIQWYDSTSIIAGATSATYTKSLSSGKHKIICKLTSNAMCKTSATALDTVIVRVTSNATPIVTLSSNPTLPVCEGTIVTVTAAPTFGGNNPTYAWYKNSIGNPIAGAGSGSSIIIDTQTSGGYISGDKIIVVLTSNLGCVTTNTAKDTLILQIAPKVTPGVTVSVPGGTICSGNSVIFTANATNAGTNPGPDYQWSDSNGPVGGNSSTYSTTVASAGTYSVTCTITVKDTIGCFTTTTASGSNSITVTQSVTPTLSVSAVPDTNICTGTKVTFTANSTNPGANPIYTWKVNNVQQQSSNSPTFAYTFNTATDVPVSCEFTSNATCATKTKDTVITTVHVSPKVTPVVTIQGTPASNIAVCPGTPVNISVTFTANEGFPSYKWYKNSISNAPIDSGGFITINTSNYSNNDKIICVMTSTLSCVTSQTAMDTFVLNILTPKVPSVSISANPSGAICSGTSVTFNASPVNGGTGPTFNWYVASGSGYGPSQGTGSTFTHTFNTKDTIKCVLTSSDTCVSPTTASVTYTPAFSATIVPDFKLSVTAGPYCQGSTATFSVGNIVGAPATFAWIDNAGTPKSGAGNSFTSNALANGTYAVTCTMTSTSGCASPTTAVHDTTITVRPNVTPTISVSASPNTNLCPNTSITFTIDTTAGHTGSAPTFSWSISPGSLSGTAITKATTLSAGTYTVTGSVVSNAACANPTNTSANVTVVVNPNQLSSATISANPTGSLCPNQPVTFTLNHTNPGAAPTYQWYVNGVKIAGAIGTTFKDSFPSTSTIKCVFTSNALCVTNPKDSVSTTITIINNVKPTLTVSAPAGPFCPSQTINFTTKGTGRGNSPTYQWYINSILVPTATDSTFTPPTISVIPGTYWVRCKMTSSIICVTTPSASDSVQITVNSNVTASVSLTSVPSGTICEQNLPVVFTATPGNGGTTPAYQWYVNGGKINGATSSTYTANTLPLTPDSVRVTMTSNAVCVLGSPASDTVNVNILPKVIPTISITTPYTGNNICPNTPVDFTATITNGGNTPTYQWLLDGANVGTNSNLYSAIIPTAGAHTVKCVLTSSATCAVNPANSNQLTVNIVTTLPGSVSVSNNNAGPVCPGAVINYTATGTNGGTPTFMWRINNDTLQPFGPSNTFSFTTDNKRTGSLSIVCEMKSSLSCATPNPASNTTTLVVNPSETPSVTIVASTTDTCALSPITLTATPDSAGNNPTYQWYEGNKPIQTGNPITVSTLKDQDVITCVMTSSAPCPTQPTATSNGVTVTIHPILPVTLSVSSSPDTVCQGQPIQFTAVSQNGGNPPTYSWVVNKTQDPNATDSTYSSTNLNNGDSVTCVMISNALCPSKPITSAGVKVNVLQWKDATINIAADSNVCSGQKVTFNSTIANGGSAPVYQWHMNGQDITGSDFAMLTRDSVNNNDVFSATLTSNAKCINVPTVNSNSIKMNVTPMPVLVITPDSVSTCYGNPIPLKVIGADSYSWNPTEFLSCSDCDDPVALPENTTVYTVTGTTNNCSSTDTVRLIIGCKYIFAPTTFTPNGDGINDRYRVYGPKINNFAISIFDRWGKLVYHSTDQLEGWDGKCKGIPVNSGVYVWVINGNIAGNKLSVNGVATGDLTLFTIH